MYGYVYLITNKVNGKRYVGMHKSPHIDDSYFASGLIINRALDKHGRDAFDRDILATAGSRKEMCNVEKRFIAELDPEYNLTVGGDGGAVKCPELLERLRILATGRPVSEETRSRISKSLVGKRKGVTFSDDHKKKISEGMKGKLKGKRITDQHKQNISKATKGRVLSEQTVEKRKGQRTGWRMWNDGTVTKYAKECPGPSFVLGRVKK